MALVQKTLDISIVEKRADGGRITINTGTVDRDKDRVFPAGGRVENYMLNPVVLWGHNYFEPWALIGNANTLDKDDARIVADFTLREPASETDPQHIIRLLWDQEFVRASSIGFRPNYERTYPNDFGGLDFIDWELLEFSLVSVPANQEALRLGEKQHPGAMKAFKAAMEKAGRVLSKRNEKRIRTAHDELVAVLGELDEESEDDGKGIQPPTLPLSALERKLTERLDALAQQLTEIKASPRPAQPAADIDEQELQRVLERLNRFSIVRQ